LLIDKDRSQSLPAVSLAGSGFKTNSGIRDKTNAGINADNIRHFSYRPKSSLHFFKKEKSHARAAQALAPREGAKTQSFSSNFQTESI